MADTSRMDEGYLVMADISGYTAFLTGTELEHAQAIVAELISTIQSSLVPPLRFVKLEGDGVFCYCHSSSFAEGERLVELLEVCYFDFSTLLLNMARSTTCGCAACASIGSLDLKFVVHYGAFFVQSIAGAEDIVGSDVILVHRLLKNGVTEQTGCRAYVLFTEPCVQHLPGPFTSTLPRHSEVYESFGEVTGGVLDLNPVVEQMREARREYVGPEDADFEMSGTGPAPPALVWQYFVDPEKRLRWEFDETGITNSPNGRGRLGVGATSHCAHKLGADILRRYVDWRPFSYFTVTATPVTASFLPFPAVMETTEFVPLEDGATEVRFRFRLLDRGWLARARLWVLRPFIRRAFSQSAAKLVRALQEDGLGQSLVRGAH